MLVALSSLTLYSTYFQETFNDLPIILKDDALFSDLIIDLIQQKYVKIELYQEYSAIFATLNLKPTYEKSY